MNYLVDSNVLLRIINRQDVQHVLARNAARRLSRQGHLLQITAQNCIEFWNVATRPFNKNGLGLNTVSAGRQLRIIERLFPILPEQPNVYSEWRRLVMEFSVSGIQVHDARLVAAMRLNDLTHILTFDTSDFARYAGIGIVAVDPQTI